MNSTTETIKKGGLKVTPTRLAVINVLEKATKPLDVSDILRELENNKIYADQATVYRIIENFYNKGLINKLQFIERKFFYETKGTEHHHAICTNCGEIEDISGCSIETLEKEIKKTRKFEVKTHSLEFFGLCKNCQ